MNPQANKPSGWVGWIFFAGFMMMLLGALQGLSGLTAIFKDNFYVVTQNHLLLFNFKTWGWIDLILGIVIFMAGYELFRGAIWARVLAIFLAGLSIFANMAFIQAYPIWSIIMIVIDVVIIYALFVHGDDLRTDDR